jgi:hypothetical protein
MRKFVISLAAAGAALAIATPASAQYYQGRAPVAYGEPYGYQGNFGMVRELQQRLNNVERQINRLDRRDRIGDWSADRLRAEAANLHRRLYDRGRNGLDRREAGDIIVRLQRLEQRVQYAMNQRGARYGYNGYQGQWNDRDRDGRNDRYEDDQGYRRDR